MKRLILLSLAIAMFSAVLVGCHAEGDVGHSATTVLPGR